VARVRVARLPRVAAGGGRGEKQEQAQVHHGAQLYRLSSLATRRGTSDQMWRCQGLGRVLRAGAMLSAYRARQGRASSLDVPGRALY
jgi:hypothetical protein